MQQTTWQIVIEQTKKQGLPFLLLAIGVWYFESRQDKMEEQFLSCQEEKFRILQETVSQNTATLQQLNETIRTISQTQPRKQR